MAYQARVTILASAPIKTCSLWLAMNDGSGSTGPGTIQGDTRTYAAAASKAFSPGYPKLRYTVTAFDGQTAASAP